MKSETIEMNKFRCAHAHCYVYACSSIRVRDHACIFVHVKMHRRYQHSGCAYAMLQHEITDVKRRKRAVKPLNICCSTRTALSQMLGGNH